MLAMPDVQTEFRRDGLEPIGGSPEELRSLVAAEIEKWGKVIKAAGIQPN
jgi:tripartite-type tricarboxylate transporter receptor subunit TctC